MRASVSRAMLMDIRSVKMLSGENNRMMIG